MRIAVTGHRDLTVGTVDLVRTGMIDLLSPYAPAIVGVSCLAAGADQIFAQTVLDLGGALEAVLPAQRFRAALPAPDRAVFDRLLRRASRVRRLTGDLPTPSAYAAANSAMLDRAELLLAVWDGHPALGPGGTAEVVSRARSRAIRVEVIWPNGSKRSNSC